METGGCLDLLEASWARLGRRTKVWISTLGIIGLGLVFGACALGMGWSLKAILDKQEKTTFDSGGGPNQTTPHQTVFDNATGYNPNNGSSLHQIQERRAQLLKEFHHPAQWKNPTFKGILKKNVNHGTRHEELRLQFNVTNMPAPPAGAPI